MKNLNYFFLLFALPTILLSSCTLESRVYRPGFFVENHKKDIDKKTIPSAQQESPVYTAQATHSNQPESSMNTNVTPDTETINLVTANSETQTTEPIASITEKNNKPGFFAKSIHFLKKGTMNENISHNLNFIKHKPLYGSNANSIESSDVDIIVAVVLAFLLPPLSVFLVDGLGRLFWVDLILTLFFWIPGVVFALLVALGII